MVAALERNKRPIGIFGVDQHVDEVRHEFRKRRDRGNTSSSTLVVNTHSYFNLVASEMRCGVGGTWNLGIYELISDVSTHEV